MSSEHHKVMIKKWIEDHSDELYSWAVYKTGDSTSAQDLVQDTFTAAWTALPGFKGDSKPRTWLFSILNHKVADHFKKKFRDNTRLTDPSPGSMSENTFFQDSGEWDPGHRPDQWSELHSGLLDDPGFVSILNQCMDHLPEHWSYIVKLKYLENAKGKVICQELGISDTNYWQILHRAKLQLRDCIENNWKN